MRLAAAGLALAGMMLGARLILGDPEAAAQDGPEAAAARTNVVVIMTDDQEVRSLRVMKAVRRQLQDRGTTFENFFATFPLCCPSRATFLTGQYSHNHRVRSNSPPDGGWERFDDRRTVATWLGRSGYRTGYVGKYFNGYGGRGNDPRYVPPGWDQWVGKTDGGMFDYELNVNGRLVQYGDSARDYQTDVLAGKGARFIGESSRRARPFFLTVATSAPHTERREPPPPAPRHRGAFDDEPLPKPPSFNEQDVSDKPSFVRSRPLIRGDKLRDLKRQYRGRLASLLAVDDAVQKIVGKLRRTGELANTLIVYTSDNGYLLGEHRLTRKTLLYEESAKVPLIMRGPGVPPGQSREQVTGNVDLSPTILDVANADATLTQDGRSLMPLAANPTQDSDRSMLLENGESVAVRAPNYMYAEHSGGEKELYDMRADPFQLQSLDRDPDHAADRQRLAERLDQLKGCEGEGCR